MHMEFTFTTHCAQTMHTYMCTVYTCMHACIRHVSFVLCMYPACIFCSIALRERDYLEGLTGSSTNSESLPLSNFNTTVFAAVARWTNSTGQLVVSLLTGDTPVATTLSTTLTSTTSITVPVPTSSTPAPYAVPVFYHAEFYNICEDMANSFIYVPDESSSSQQHRSTSMYIFCLFVCLVPQGQGRDTFPPTLHIPTPPSLSLPPSLYPTQPPPSLPLYV